jgi:hypothetical protein
MEGYKLEKWLWTTEDYETMGWHDATIRAIAFLPETYELALDIDYIFEWIEPAGDDRYYGFMVAPATLVFENLNQATIDLDLFDDVQLQDITRTASRVPNNAEFIDEQIEWHWVIESNVGEIKFWSVGYKQFIRQNPRLTRTQKLSLEERQGFSFDRNPR